MSLPFPVLLQQKKITTKCFYRGTKIKKLPIKPIFYLSYLQLSGDISIYKISILQLNFLNQLLAHDISIP